MKKQRPEETKWLRLSLTASKQRQILSLGSLAPAEKAVAPHSSTLAWKIPWMEEPGGL